MVRKGLSKEVTFRTWIINSMSQRLHHFQPREQVGEGRSKNEKNIRGQERAGGWGTVDASGGWALEAQAHGVDLMPSVMEATEGVSGGNDPIQFPFLRDH